MEYRAGAGCPQMLLTGDPTGWRPMEAGIVLLADGHEVFVPAASLTGYDDSGLHAVIDGARRYFDYSVFALSVIVEKLEHFMIWSSQSQTTVPRV
ncbi:MAG TPA: hypothetical protein VFJ85_10095 [Acidimicrobiales bacterium]|nr:hypothetical protein [Acidimicrobiales bacterium]